MKAKTKHPISQAVSFVFDMAIAASGLNETIDVKKLVRDFFMYGSLLLLQLRNGLRIVFSYIGLRMVKHNALLAHTSFILACAAFMLHVTTAKILLLFVMIAMAGVLVKMKAKEDSFVNGSFL